MRSMKTLASLHFVADKYQNLVYWVIYFIEIIRQISKRQLEVSPPSICRMVPLIIFAMSLSKKTTPSATSLGSEIEYKLH